MPLRPRRQSGFTLIEAIVAVGIAALLMAALMATLTATVRTFTHVQESARETRLACGLDRVLRHDLESIYNLTGESITPLVGQIPSVSGLTTVLEFFCTASLAPRDQRPAQGIVRVEYLMRPSERVKGAYELLRREAPYTLGKPLERTQEPEPLVDGIKGWRLEFQDGKGWRTDWNRVRLPAAVRLSFMLAQPADPMEPAASSENDPFESETPKIQMLFVPTVSIEASPLPPEEKPKMGKSGN